MELKNIVGDFFKTIDTAKEDIESQIEKNKTKLYDTCPALKEMEEKFSSKAEEMKSTIKETINNAKGSFSRTEDSNVEEATIVEESEKLLITLLNSNRGTMPPFFLL